LILGFLYGVIQAYTLKSSSLYPEYNFLFILFAVVLFLQTWTTIRRKYKGVLRWMAVSAILIVGASFVFSRINVIDYKKLNEVVLNKNISYVYQIDYPVCEYFNRIERHNLVEDLYLIAPKSKHDTPMLIYQEKKYLLSEIFDIKTKVNSNHPEYDRPYLTYRLHIDRKTPMKYVYQLTDSLSGYGMNKIGYVVSTLQPKLANPNNVLFMQLPTLISPQYYRKSGGPPIPPPIIPTNLRQFSNRIIVEYNKISNGILVNGKNIEERKLTTCFKENIEHDFNYVCFICKNDNQPYESFISVLSHLMIAVENIRNIESQKCRGVNFNDLMDYEMEEKIRKEIPLHIFNVDSIPNDTLMECNCH
jgi:biopolymer transport protein ExbD